MTYSYRTVEGKWRANFKKITLSNKPLNFIRIDTTGIDPETDKLIGINILKVKDSIIDSHLNEYIHTDVQLSDFIKNYTGIKESDIKNAKSIDEVMDSVREYLEEDCILIGFNISFIGSFIKDYNLPVGVTLDLNQISKAVFRGKSGYRFLADKFKVDNPYSIYKGLLKFIPLGIETPPPGINKYIKVNGEDIEVDDKYFFDEYDVDKLYKVMFDGRKNVWQ